MADALRSAEQVTQTPAEERPRERRLQSRHEGGEGGEEEVSGQGIDRRPLRPGEAAHEDAPPTELVAQAADHPHVVDVRLHAVRRRQIRGGDVLEAIRGGPLAVVHEEGP